MASFRWLLALECCLLSVFVAPDLASCDEPPIMWLKQSPDRTNWYHLVYQVHMYDKDESVTMEEWADYNAEKYRLDSVKDGNRSTYLHLGGNIERFVYKPFTCQQIKASQIGLLPLANLLIGRRVGDNESHDIYGLGHMWEEMKARHKDGKTDTNYIANGGDFHEFPDQFEQYVFNVNEERFTGMVRFYFAKGDHGFDTVDWATKGADGKVTLLARAKVIHLDFEPLDDYIFKLPIGYGCTRIGTITARSYVGLTLFNPDHPQQVSFNVIFSEPKDNLLHSWTSEHYSVRVVQNSVQRLDNKDAKESYYSALIQSRGPDDGKVKRVRQVSWAPDSAKGQAIVYKIDQSTGECQVSHRDVKDQIIVGTEGSPATPEQYGTKMSQLSMDTILSLFRDDDSYSLVDEGELLDQGRFRNRYYEKRVENFELTSDHNVTWRYPVSIVKRVSSYAINYLHEADNAYFASQKAKLALFSKDQAATTIFFFSEGYKKLLHKVVIEIAANHEVSYAYAHDQLDVSACFDDTERPSEEISVKYPIGDTKLVKKLEEKEEAIKSALAKNLFSMDPKYLRYLYGDEIIGLSSLVSPLQISDIQVSFDTFNVHIKMTVLDVPLSHLFKMEADQKLTASADENSLLEMSASTADKCADHCDFYNCPRFSYDPAKKTCQVELVGGHSKAIAWFKGQLYSYYDQLRRSEVVEESSAQSAATHERAGERMHMDPRSIVQYFERAIDVIDQQFEWLLVLKINLRPYLKYVNDDKKNEENIVKLTPESISHELDTFREYVRELNEEQAEGSGAVRVLNDGSARIKLQYVKFLENRKYVDSKRIGRHFEGLATYEQCEQFCEINDCHSFQYCNIDESCIVSQSNGKTGDNSAEFEEASAEQECSIYLLDNLSKFENFGIVPKPKRDFDLTYPSYNLQACANTCMNRHYDSCQGFYYCSAKEKRVGKPEDMCQLTNIHLNSYTDEQRELAFGNQVSRVPSTVRECTFYSRSYLTQFDKYRGKSFFSSDWAPNTGTTVGWSGKIHPEDCASRCIEEDCLAFESCPAYSSKDGSELKSDRYGCRIMLDVVEKRHLEHNPRCSVFVLSDKSQFNKRGTKLILDDSSSKSGAAPVEPDEKAAISVPDGTAIIDSAEEINDNDISGPDLELLQIVADANRRRSAAEMLHDASSSSHWLARLFSFFIGTISGCLLVVAWNEAYARGWFDRARSGIATSFNRNRF